MLRAAARAQPIGQHSRKGSWHKVENASGCKVHKARRLDPRPCGAKRSGNHLHKEGHIGTLSWLQTTLCSTHRSILLFGSKGIQQRPSTSLTLTATRLQLTYFLTATYRPGKQLHQRSRVQPYNTLEYSGAVSRVRRELRLQILSLQ